MRLEQQVGPRLHEGFQEAEGRQVSLLQQQLVLAGGFPLLRQSSGRGVPMPEEEQGPRGQSQTATASTGCPTPLFLADR